MSVNDTKSFLKGAVSKKLLLLNCGVATLYVALLTFGFEPSNLWLFYGLIAGEVFRLFQIYGFTHSIWHQKHQAEFDQNFSKPVDIFITVCGEPVELVSQTAKAALAMDYPNFKVYLLNDGRVAQKDNWQEIEGLAKRLDIDCITREVGGGAKAGNINNALKVTASPYVVIFDADHVPYPSFLQEVMGYFKDKKVGFVQTPQYYKNQSDNVITQTAWDQQALFFGPIMSGKNRLNSAFMCGTNMALSREALEQAGGMCEFNIAEDFLTSLFVHDKGWKSVYIPKVLAEGLAPEDFLSYYKQQFRWTRGSLEVIFKYNPIFKRGLKWAQKLQYLVSASYFLSGLVFVFDALLPIIFLYTGITAVTTNTMNLAFIFVPYIFLTLYVLQKSCNFSLSFNAISFSISAFVMQLRAILAVLLNQKTAFAVTSKQGLQGNFLYLVIPHIAYIALAAIGLVVAVSREGFSASLMANLAWVVVNAAVFMPFILAAAPPRRRGRNRAQNMLALMSGRVSKS